ncbi:MAG: glycosyltransferase family 2 protein [Clostridia bacterium]|nr:glycosyltransferase family 2 protein [Clostridia bacterium]
MKLEVLTAAMNQCDHSLRERMNVDCDLIIANQCDKWEYTQSDKTRMLSTATRGVGVNRNLAIMLSDADILLFADDDVTYYDKELSGVLSAFKKRPDADVIVFSLDYTKNGEIIEKRRCKSKRLRLHNALRYGAARIAVRKSSIIKHGITFSTLFGGGCIYGSGEDSLFLCDCFRAGLKVYSDPYLLGNCSKDGSTWFGGYNEKFMFDKGAFIACAFPKTKHLMKWYFAYKFSKRSSLSLGSTLGCMNRGIKAFKTLSGFDDK